MSYRRLLSRYPSVLAFGVVTASVGGLGQTFYVSLFVPDVLESFALERTAYGTLYGVATLGAALLLPAIGRRIDRVAVLPYAVTVALAFAVACLTVAVAKSVLVLALGLLLLRLCGQGLMAHISSTTMARFFTSARGRALGIASLGHPLAEATLPLVATALLSAFDWRQVWLLSVAGVCVYVLVAALLLGRRDTRPHAFRDVEDAPEGAPEMAAGGWTRGELLKDARFWLLVPWYLTPAFVLTGLFFHQLQLAEEKGWSEAWLASSFLGYAMGRTALSFLAGPLVDRFSARRVLPFHLLPFAVGLFVLGLTSAKATSWLYLSLAGITVGLGANSKAAFLPEMFGVRHLGAIKSALMSLGVLSTALSPPLFGWLLDEGVTFSVLAPALGAGCLVVTGVGMAGVALLVRDPRPRRPSTKLSTGSG